MNKFWGLGLLLVFLVWQVAAVKAIAPIEVNNKFGIHLTTANHEEIKAAANLVNGKTGNWGYVTLVIPDNDLNVDKWQAVFDELRIRQLIPIVRLATHGQGENWVVPQPQESQKWVRFLNHLNWVTQNRYLILFNEPNHSNEWGGRVDAEAYADVALAFAKALKEANSDYFVMLAGLDQAAPQQLPRYGSAEYFLKTVVAQMGVEDYQRYFDGLSSHSYPNPGFTASVYNRGWGSVVGYEVELALLRSLGVKKELPVFVTETGWRHDLVGEAQAASNFVIAYTQLWLKDPRVVAVTPFVLNYQSEPFLGFSWQKPDSADFYQPYQAVAKLNKTRGFPAINENVVFNNRLPKQLVEDSSFLMTLKFTNLGQGFWDSQNGYDLRLISPNDYRFAFSSLKDVAPGEESSVDFNFYTPKQLGQTKVKIGLFHDEQKVVESDWWRVKIVPLQKLTVSYRLLALKNQGNNFKVEIYDQDQRLIFSQSGLKGQKGQISVDKIRNVGLGEKYRVVLLKPGYLPRQTFVTFQAKGNLAKMKWLLPLDWNNDGAWSFADIKSLFDVKNRLH